MLANLMLLGILLPSCSHITPPYSLPQPKKAILHTVIPLLVPAACSVAEVTHSEASHSGSELEMGKAGLKVKGERQSDGESLGDCVVSTPGVTSFRFTSAAKLE